MTTINPLIDQGVYVSTYASHYNLFPCRFQVCQPVAVVQKVVAAPVATYGYGYRGAYAGYGGAYSGYRTLGKREAEPAGYGAAPVCKEVKDTQCRRVPVQGRRSRCQTISRRR